MRAAGKISRISSRFLELSSAAVAETPVILPLGRARLDINPVATGSPAGAMTIGISVVACLAAATAGFENRITLLRNSVAKVLSDPEFKSRVTQFGLELEEHSTPETFAALSSRKSRASARS